MISFANAANLHLYGFEVVEDHAHFLFSVQKNQLLALEKQKALQLGSSQGLFGAVS